MHRPLTLALLIIVAHAAILSAQESGTPQPAPSEDSTQDLVPRFRGRALVLEINARVVEQNQTVTWNESHRKNTIPGRPVGLRLVGENLVVVVQFTPYLRRGAEKLLVAQGQIWMNVPDQGMRYHTSMQTIPMEYGDPIYFFPLGPVTESDSASIEVMLTIYPYEEN